MTQMTFARVDEIVLEKLSQHSSWISLDLEYFLDLLKNSLSLWTFEKIRVIDSVPILTQYQFDDLIDVFLEEREKFRELMKQHPDDIKKLLEKQKKDWIEIWEYYDRIEKTKEKAKEDQEKIDDLKAKLWL